MNGYQSIATIKSPEFINLQPCDLNPMMSKCEIKVFYLGKNRNGTAIDQNTAKIMAKTLRGAPIVGYYKKDKGDFFDHGDQIIYDGEGVHFNSLTRPYGFVSPDAQVWFQEFEEFDDSGKSVLRTYLMTTGYLWTGQYEEAQQVFMDGGKPHSMELDEKSMQGFWSKEANDDCEFFIINDAIFSKLCILGDDVEPCFEGSSVTAPNVSKTFTLDDNFKRTLYSMMQELKQTLQGGTKEVEDNTQVVETAQEAVDTAVQAPADQQVETESTLAPEGAPAAAPEQPIETPAPEQAAEIPAENLDNNDQTEAEKNAVNTEDPESDFANKEDKEEEKTEDKEDTEEDDDKKKEKDYAYIQIQLEELQASFNALKASADSMTQELETLRKYKADIEEAQKDALIAEFSVLSDEDKKDVIEHKSEYSLDEIKSKLAVICFDKKVSYTVAKETAEEVHDTQFTVDVSASKELVPEWLQAVDRYIQK